MRSLLLAFCIGLPLIACQNGVQGPPPTFSPRVQAHFEQYMAEINPGLFVVSTDGQAAFYSYCPPYADRCLETGQGSKSEVLRGCEEKSGGVPCHVYAIGRGIVWTNGSGLKASNETHGTFDGLWQGTMLCSDCENCVGGITKDVQIDIQGGSFEIFMDSTYHGEGVVDKKGNMQIHYKTLEDYWTVGSPPKLDFAGKLVEGVFQLEGMRGSRECSLSLSKLAT